MAVSQIERWKAPDGTVLAMRPIHERDGTRIANALRNLSPETRRLRFLTPVNEIPGAFVRGLTEEDSSRQYGVIVVRQDGGDEVAIAGGRIAAGDETGIWEFALLVGDAWQGKGVGKHLLKALVEEAKHRNLQRILGHISVDNRPMLKLARKSGFSIARDAVDTSTCIATLEIDSRPKVKRSWFARWFGY